MQRYNQRMIEQLKVRQQQEKGRLPKIQRSEGKTRMAMYKKSLHINSSGSASEQREKIKQVKLVEIVVSMLKVLDCEAHLVFYVFVNVLICGKFLIQSVVKSNHTNQYFKKITALIALFLVQKL